MQRFAELFRSAQQTMEQCRVQSHEKVVVFADSGKSPALVEAFYTAALATGAETVRVHMTTRPQPLMNPPESAIQAMIEADVVFDLATNAWLYTDATNRILDSGTRMLQVLVGEETVIARPPNDTVRRREEIATKILGNCRTFRITSDDGTDLVMERGDRPVHTQGGSVDHPGDWDSIGVCLGAFAPLEDSANGTIVFNGTLYLPSQHLFRVERPIEAEVKDGRITHITADHREAKILEEWLRSWDDPNSYVIAHTGFGIDERAQLHPPDPGNWESYLAGVNVAFGGNKIPQLQGATESKSHFDAILLGVTVELDGTRVIEGGQFVAGTGLES